MRKHGGPKRRTRHGRWDQWCDLSYSAGSIGDRRANAVGQGCRCSHKSPLGIRSVSQTFSARSRRPKDRQRYDRRRLRHTRMPRCGRRPRRSCNHPGSQRHKALKGQHCRSHGSKSGSSRCGIYGPRTLRRLSEYNHRSRVETKMRCVKTLGQCLMARDFGRQGTELRARIALLKGYTTFGILLV